MAWICAGIVFVVSLVIVAPLIQLMLTAAAITDCIDRPPRRSQELSGKPPGDLWSNPFLPPCLCGIGAAVEYLGFVGYLIIGIALFHLVRDELV